MEYVIRKRKLDDIKDIEHVTTVSWNETYTGLIDQSYLDDIRLNEKKRVEKNSLEFDPLNNNCLVLEVDGKVVGFIMYGISDDNAFDKCGEVYSLYILSEYKGNGFGRKLVDEAKKKLKKLGFDKMLISCLKQNPSNNFYIHIGGKYIKDKIYKRLQLPENVYYFDI